MSDTRERGSAGRLRGTVYGLDIFVSDAEGDWTDAEKSELLRNQKVAQAWLVREARRYDVQLDFHRGGVFGLEEDVEIPFIQGANGSGAEYAHWVDYLLRRIGWQDSLALEQHLRDHHGVDAVHVMAFLARQGRSYALPTMRMNQLEGCALYRDSRTGAVETSATMAHELLHLYGAWDLYETFEVSAEQASLAEDHFPDDIMRRTDDDLDALSVGPLTAWRVGWAPMREAWYPFFKPSRR